MVSRVPETKPTILIVDDEERNRALLEALLKDGDFEIYMAESGMEALLLAEGVAPDLILLDVMMPGMDGFQVCRKIREHAGLSTVPVIMVTALNDRASMLKGLESGADEFLHKPIDGLELTTRVRTITRLNRVQQLQQERVNFRIIADDARDAYMLVRRDGTISYRNQSAIHLLGTRGEAVPLREQLDSVFQLEPEEAWDNWNAVWESPGEIRYLLQAQTVNNAAKWFRFSLLAATASHEGERLCRITDVSSLMHQQRERWSFESAVCHKLRTPLTGIIAVSEIIRKHITTEGLEMLELMKQATDRLESQVKGVTRLVESPRALTGGSCNVGEAIEIARDCAQNAGVRLLSEFSQLSESVDFSIGALGFEAIVGEILANSVRFHPEGQPTIDMEIKEHSSGCLEIKFTDDGVRIAKDHLPLVGQPFFQSEENFTGELPGMGVGLSMVSSILKEVGGELSISNRSEKPGVTVSLLISHQESETTSDESPE
jgi:two-component system, cell cycle response regulator